MKVRICCGCEQHKCVKELSTVWKILSSKAWEEVTKAMNWVEKFKGFRLQKQEDGQILNQPDTNAFIIYLMVIPENALKAF